MLWVRTIFVAFLLVVAVRAGAAELPAAKKLSAEEATTLFSHQVQPLLKAKCQGCHGDDKELRGNFDVRWRDGLLKGGDNGPALMPGDAAGSPLYQSVLRTGDTVMPPKKEEALSPAEIAALRDWINAGAPWSEAAAARKFDEKDTWAYRPIQNPPVPKCEHLSDAERAERIRNPIDAFLEAKLQEKKITPAPPSDARTLLRRVTHDLTGLPPGREDAARFGKEGDHAQVPRRDKSADTPAAWNELVERLLASPHYGERQAQHWLDVVRYADTSGFANDYERPNAWRYRDWVIDAFNRDVPFDEFIIEQIAGDELRPGDPAALIATGYLRMGPWEHTAMSVAALTRQLFLDDVTNSVGVTFLGQGLSCCRCHDHKFDPLPTRDYYRIQACFAGTQFDEAKAGFLPRENAAEFAAMRQVVERQLAGGKLKKQTEESDTKTFSMISGKQKDYLERARARFAPLAFAVKNDKPQEVFILKGGALDAAADRVTPGVLSAVFASDDTVAASEWNTVPSTTDGRRLALARWIASPRNTLTARVIVNRVWQQHFGTGIVATPNSFGKMGDKPSHPELLDWLATWFIDNGWSVKKLHRLIVTSAAYQRGGEHVEFEKLREIDPKNRLLAFFPPRRLSAEEIRDGLLAITGELNPERGGPGVFPELNWDVALQPRHIMGGIAPAYQPSPLPKDRHRRSIYAFRIRTLADPMLEVLNKPGTELSCERRDETTVTPQVFALLNGNFTHDRAIALAAKISGQHEAGGGQQSSGEQGASTGEPRALATGASIKPALAAVFHSVLNREPTADEFQLAASHYEKMLAHHRANPPQPQKLPTTVARKIVSEQTGELFRWEEQLDTAHFVPDKKSWEVSPEVRALAELCLVLMNSNELMYVY